MCDPVTHFNPSTASYKHNYHYSYKPLSKQKSEEELKDKNQLLEAVNKQLHQKLTETQVRDPPDLCHHCPGECMESRGTAPWVGASLQCPGAQGQKGKTPGLGCGCPRVRAAKPPPQSGTGLICLHGTPIGRTEGPDPKGGAAGEVSG